MGKLSKLKGIGVKSEGELNKIGIYTKEQLQELGAINAFLKLRKACRTKPSINLLYAMAAALKNPPQTKLTESEKGRLLFELEEYRELERILSTENGKVSQSSKVNREFEKIPGVGTKINQDLIDLGYQKIADLKGENPEVIYQKLMELRGTHIDRCMLYVFRCAVYYAGHFIHDPALLKWWNWKDKKY